MTLSGVRERKGKRKYYTKVSYVYIVGGRSFRVAYIRNFVLDNLDEDLIILFFLYNGKNSSSVVMNFNAF